MATEAKVGPQEIITSTCRSSSPHSRLRPEAKELWGLSITELGQLGKTGAQALPAWGHGTDSSRETLVLEAAQWRGSWVADPPRWQDIFTEVSVQKNTLEVVMAAGSVSSYEAAR